MQPSLAKFWWVSYIELLFDADAKNLPKAEINQYFVTYEPQKLSSVYFRFMLVSYQAVLTKDCWFSSEAFWLSADLKQITDYG